MRKIEIIPALLSSDFRDFKKKIKRLKKEVKKKKLLVQIDLCDEVFVPSKTILKKPNKKETQKILDILGDYQMELDLMIDLNDDQKIKKWFDIFEILKPKRMIFHLDSLKNWDLVFQEIKARKIKAEIGLGVQIKHKCKSDILKVFEKYNFKYIQFMGIEKIGFGGQKLSSKVFRKIRKFHKLKPEFSIQVDGGVKKENSQKLAEAGVNRFVAGSGIFGAENLEKRIKEFLK